MGKWSNFAMTVLIAFLLCCFGGANSFANSAITHADFSDMQNCFNTSDGRMAYVDEGRGKPIVLLHGVPTSGWLFREMIDGLVAEGYRVIIPDMLGFGNSDSPVGESVYSPANHAKRLLELMNALGIESWTHIMHDAGAIWTAELLKQAPESINGIVAINAVVDVQSANWDKRLNMGLAAKMGLKLQQLGLKKNSFMTRFIVENSSLEKPSKEVLYGFEAPMRAGKMNAIYAHYAHVLRELTKPTISEISFEGKMLAIWGTNDDFIPWETQEKKAMQLYKLKPKNIHLIDGGHLAPQESSIFLDSMIVDFIDPR